MSARKYSEDLANAAAEMRETGATYSAIASALGMSPSTVYYHCLRLGADSPSGALQKPPPLGPMTVRRSGHTVRRFTPEEDRRLIEMERDGLGPMEMGRQLGRRHNSVRGRLMTLARHDEREELRELGFLPTHGRA